MKDPETLARRKAEMALANKLIVLRTNRRWVAEQLGISFAYLNQLAYGRCAINSVFKVKVADFVGMSVEDIFPNGAAAV